MYALVAYVINQICTNTWLYPTDVDDNFDELEMLPDIDCDLLISDTTAIKATIAKVGFFYFVSVFCSTHHLGLGSCICSGLINHHLITCVAANLH